MDGDFRSKSAATTGWAASEAIANNRQPRMTLFQTASNTGMLLLRALLQRIIHTGTLTILSPHGRTYIVGDGLPAVTIRIADTATVWRLLANPDLTLGEAYMNGTLIVEGGNIYDLLELCLANLGRGHGHWVQRANALGQRLMRRLAQHNPIGVAQSNVKHHYDLSDTLYELFLDVDRQYSCAYYRTPDDSLELAQDHKKKHIAAKLLLSPGQRILDIGSGWGGLAIHLAQAAKVDVTGVTLSTEQHEHASRRAEQAGLSAGLCSLPAEGLQARGRALRPDRFRRHVRACRRRALSRIFQEGPRAPGGGWRCADSYDRSCRWAGRGQCVDQQVYLSGRVHAGALRDRARGRARRTPYHRYRSAALALRRDPEGLAAALHDQARAGRGNLRRPVLPDVGILPRLLRSGVPSFGPRRLPNPAMQADRRGATHTRLHCRMGRPTPRSHQIMIRVIGAQLCAHL